MNCKYRDTEKVFLEPGQKIELLGHPCIVGPQRTVLDLHHDLSILESYNHTDDGEIGEITIEDNTTRVYRDHATGKLCYYEDHWY